MKETRAEYLPISKLHPFEGHPFKVTDNEEMDQLVWSILTQGLLTPLVVRPLDNGEYEVISGHRRLHACKKAGIETVPALITDMDRDSAAIALVDSNLHREKILPSEKAFAYKLKLEAMNRQGQRTDLTSTQDVSKFRTNELIGEANGDSRETVRRYIRLTHLLPELLAKVDEGQIAFTPAVHLVRLTVSKVLTDEAIDQIADAIVIMQDQEDTVTPVLKQQLRECEASIRNVMKAIQQGIITEATKECLEGLEAQRECLKTNILQVQMERRKFTKEEIVVWISKYKYGNINDSDYRKEIIDTFVNSVYVYEDKIVLTYNYKDGSQTLTLQEIESALSSHLTSLCPPRKRKTTHRVVFSFSSEVGGLENQLQQSGGLLLAASLMAATP